MPDFHELLDKPDAMSNAFRAIRPSMSAKEFADLGELFGNATGLPAWRDKGNRVRGGAVYTSSRIGAYLTSHFDGVGPNDKMMWVGLVVPDKRKNESWVMRPQVRNALTTLGWY